MTHGPVPNGLTHLHVHSHYTLLGATPAIPELVQMAVDQGVTSLALTDTNALYGAVTFAQACATAGIRPILGMTVTVSQPEELSGGHWSQPGEMVLLARNPAGWRSLCGLSSAIQGGPEREQIAAVGVDWELLREHRAGLICVAGGRRSWLARALVTGDAAGAARYAGRLGGVYGEDAWLGLELHTPQDEAVADATVEIGKRFGLPVAAVQPVYYLTPAERSRLRLLAAMAHNCPLDAVTRVAAGRGSGRGRFGLADAEGTVCPLRRLSAGARRRAGDRRPLRPGAARWSHDLARTGIG